MIERPEPTLQVHYLASLNSFPAVRFLRQKTPLSFAGFLIGIEKGARVHS
jgi:hypothetical protein